MTTSACNSYKVEILTGIHNPAHDYKIALFTNMTGIDATVTSYTGLSNEVVSGGGYAAGGKLLTGFSVTQVNGTGVLDFDNVSWPTSTITAAGAVIYNDSLPGKNAVVVINFGGNESSVNGNFLIDFPTPSDTEGLVVVV